jgi:uncharacterized repeat protein (TIGR01451 family)
MKRFLPPILAFLFFGFYNGAKAQYVTIPDPVFVSWLQNNGYAGCMSGNQLDTGCTAVTSATIMSCNGIAIQNLSGVQYFKHLLVLDCSSDSITTIPALPPVLRDLSCGYNKLDSLPALPPTLIALDAAINHITSFPVLPANLQTLFCDSNYLTSLPALPAGLTFLSCGNNPLPVLPALPVALTELDCWSDELVSLPALPATLKTLKCLENELTALPALPAALSYLDCEQNQLTSLPALPDSLTYLDCNTNQITSIPALPQVIGYFNCSGNQVSVLPAIPAGDSILLCSQNLLTALPALPVHLTQLSCDNNSISNLPALPAGLTALTCSQNQITNLQALPLTLNLLNCSGNQLTSLPALPPLLYDFQCDNNLLTSLPALPDSINFFSCSNNAALTCLPELKRIVYFEFNATGVTCLPDYGIITYPYPALSTLPLCGIFNPTGCQPFWNISGQCYYDENSDCRFDSTDVATNYVKTQLFSNGTLVQQTFSGGEGYYSFDSVPNGNYTVQVDTSNLPFTVSCPGSASYTVSLSPADTLSYNNNFAFKCRTVGFDVGIQSVINGYATPRPGTVFSLNTAAGDMSQPYGAHCASGISGTVQLTFNGPINYVGPATGALTPNTVSGNVVTWNIADYGTVNDLTAFNLLFKIDSLAVPGTSVCFTVNVTPTAGDYNPSNNSLTYCFPVVASLDPNEKEVYPTQVDTGGWLTYTIRFQNTGSASALNIRVLDTLSANLDPSTFQLLAYSAKNITQIFGKVVIFNFPNINLPDSLTSDSASRGFVQYKIKVKSGVAPGATINNRASIYFDSNAPVLTNTVTDSVITNCTATYASLVDTICNGDTVYVGTHAHYSSGTYVDTLTNVGGCDSIINLALTVNPVTPTLISSAGDTFCAHDTVTFTALPAGQGRYLFFIGGSLQQDSTLNTWTSAILYTGNIVSVEIVQGVCSSPRSNFDTIVLKPAPVVTFSLSSDTFCSKDAAVTLHATPIGGTYSGSGVTGNQFYPSQASLGAQTLNYLYTDTNGCSTSSSTMLYVGSLPDTVGIDSIVDSLGVTLFYTTPGIPGVMYTWQKFTIAGSSDTVISSIFNGDTLQVYCYAVAFKQQDTVFLDSLFGSFLVRCIVSIGGCIDTTNWLGSYNCQFFGAINSISNFVALTIYPNPTTDLIDIKTEGIQPQTTNIYDVNGQLVSTMRFTPQVDVSNLPAGVYLLEVTAPEGVGRRRFVKLI